MPNLPTMTYGLTPVDETPKPDRFSPILNGLSRMELRFLTEDQLRRELQDPATRCADAGRFCRRQAAKASGDMVNWWADRAEQLECAARHRMMAERNLGLVREIEPLM